MNRKVKDSRHNEMGDILYMDMEFSQVFFKLKLQQMMKVGNSEAYETILSRCVVTKKMLTVRRFWKQGLRISVEEFRNQLINH